MSGNLRRLEKLESTMLPPTGPDALRKLTWDELQVAILDVARLVVVDPMEAEDVRQGAARHVERIEAGIRYQAGLARQPSYAAHLEYVGRGRPRYVPAICANHGSDGEVQDGGGVEYQDLDKPRVMARRAALRVRPDIAALIEQGARA